MSRLVIIDRTEGWQPCQICRHLVNPQLKACDEAWHHLPCTAEGCVTDSKNCEGKQSDNGN